MSEPVIDLLEETWRSTSGLAQSFADDEWATLTECPGWSTKDILSHLIGIERKLLGLPDDPPLAEYPDYVRNDLGKFGENSIAVRRPRSGTDVLAEFDTVTTQRLAALRGMSTTEFDKPGWSPIGEVPYRQFMTVRVFDSWSHEQDIRRAVDRPGHLAGPAVDEVVAWHRRSLGFIVGKRAQAPDGSIVVFDVTGPTRAYEIVEVKNGRAAVVDQPSREPDTILRLDTEAYNALLCGRWSGPAAIADKRVEIKGNVALGQAVVKSMAYVI